MRRTVPIVTASAAAVSLLCATHANAQLQRQIAPRPETSSVTVIQPVPSTPAEIEGTVKSLEVADVKPPGEIMTVLRLDNNTDLVVPESAKAPGADVRVGSRVVADYVNTGDRKVAVFLRAPGAVEAP
jgi:hypothetical protein